MKKWPEFLVLLVALLHLLLRREDELLMMGLTKSIILPAIILYYWHGSRQKSGLVFYWLLGALFLSWLGDIFLIWSADNLYFMLGMAAFFTAHLFYAAAFSLGTPQGFGLLQRKIWPAALIIALATALYVFMYSGLGDMAVPVALYSLAIIVMVLTAVNRHGRVSNSGAIWVIVGAISFMFSDSVLALNRFRLDIPYHQFLIMPSYIFAQYAIVKGYLCFLNEGQ